jgi:predicted naringenin-chalcone synthase
MLGNMSDSSVLWVVEHYMKATLADVNEGRVLKNARDREQPF